MKSRFAAVVVSICLGVLSVAVRGVANASGEIVNVLIDSAAASTLAAGSTIRVSASGVGYVLVAAGKGVAFITNEIGVSLLHQSSYSR